MQVLFHAAITFHYVQKNYGKRIIGKARVTIVKKEPEV